MTAMQSGLAKRETGLPGLDAITHGGLPAAGATLVLGEPGAGKTVLGLQILAHALQRGGAAVFVSFEESEDQVRRDAASFRWGTALDDATGLTIIDARPPTDAAAAGGFDLEGLLAAVGNRLDATGASWIVLDGIDRLLSLEPDVRAAVEHASRLNNWCEQRGISLLLTGKHTVDRPLQPAHLEGIEFMLGTVILLSMDLVGRRLNRRLRIAKYRGTAHATDELALVMDDDGVHVPHEDPPGTAVAASTERVGTGVPRLDTVLAGGPYRGSTTLVSGQPGTAKTTLAVSFARAAAERGERVLYLSFDELADRIVRNVASVGIDLAPHLEAGRLRIESREAWRWLVEEHYIAIQRLFDELRPDCLVIDPVSALLKTAAAETAYLTTERLLGIARARGITTVLTSLTAQDTPDTEATLSHVSTLADTWITLGYHVRGGERNRSLSVVKSRGTPHSNQVRELLLSADGLDLADVYEYGSEVLMGTARVQKESEEAASRRREHVEREQRRHDLERHLEQARMRMQEAQSETERLQQELEREQQATSDAEREARAHLDDVRRRREPGHRQSEPGTQSGRGDA